MRNHPADFRPSDCPAAERLLKAQTKRPEFVGKILHHALFVELLDVTPPVCAVDPEALRIARQRVEEHGQVVRTPRGHIDPEFSFYERKRKFAFGGGDGYDRLRG